MINCPKEGQIVQTETFSKKLRLRSWRAIDGAIAQGVPDYDRSRLRRLIPIGPDEMAGGPATTRAILLRLARALRGERSRGRAGHWTYDLNRHIGLAQAWRAEKRRLQQECDAGLKQSPLR